MSVPVNEIVIAADRRTLLVDSSRWLKESISLIGLRTPISVRKRVDSGYDLVAGRQRLKAVTELGHATIDAFVYDEGTSDLDIELWEIAENVHRSDLEVMERASLTGKLARLMERAQKEGLAIPPGNKPSLEKQVSGQVDPKLNKGGRPKGGVRQLARELGRDRKQVERELKIDSLSDIAKEAAQKLGLANNQDALLKAAKESALDKQVQVLEEIAATKKQPLRNVAPKESALLSAWKAASDDERRSCMRYFRLELWWLDATEDKREKFYSEAIAPWKKANGLTR